MLKTLKDLYETLRPLPAGGLAATAGHSLQLATAVLLVEVMRADTTLAEAERQAVLAALRSQFTLGEDELARLLELAHATAKGSTDYFSFTSVINERFEMPDKIRIIEAMWRVAYADGHLDTHEAHLMWRAADLLHVPHGSYIAAKMRAKGAAA